MAFPISPVSNGDDEQLALRLHHDLNNNPRRASTTISASREAPAMKTPVRKLKLVLKNSKDGLPPTPESMASTSPSEDQIMPDAQSRINSSLEVPDHSPSNKCSHRMSLRSSWANRNDGGSKYQVLIPNSEPEAIHLAKADGGKRKLDDFDAGDNGFAPASIVDGEKMNEEVITASEPRPPRKRVATAKRPTGYMKYRRPMQDDKPEPFGEPPVWADKRQNLCEALPYYKAYMSGAYLHQGVASAFMVDKEVGPRDKFDEEVIIARV
jgi:hypothetical protein